MDQTKSTAPLDATQATSSADFGGATATGSHTLDALDVPTDSIFSSATHNKSALSDNSWVSSASQIPAYYSNNALPRTKLKPSASEVHWQRQPSTAAALHAPVLFQHQALIQRENPHTLVGAQKRWPDAGYMYGNGPPEPLDDRRHAHWFAYRELRWKRPWCLEKADRDQKWQGEDVPRLTVDDIKLFLANRFGSLKVAFQHLDFFEDGCLSRVEWQEGLYQLFVKDKLERYRFACNPRSVFNTRTGKIFKALDKDGDGLISFEDLAQGHLHVDESTRELSERLQRENPASEVGQHRESPKPTTGIQSQDCRSKAFFHTGTWTWSKAANRYAWSCCLDFAEDSPGCDFKAVAHQKNPEKKKSSTEQLGGTRGSLDFSDVPILDEATVEKLGTDMEMTQKPEDFASPKNPKRKLSLPDAMEAHHSGSASDLLRDFSTVLLQRYPNLRVAFDDIDTSRNGSVSMSEFVISAKKFFAGDLKVVFKELDKDANGTISREEFKALRALPRESGNVMDTANLVKESPSRKEEVAMKRAREGTLGTVTPGPHKRGMCLASLHGIRPYGERIHSSANFYSFAREGTRRMDNSLHPNQLAATDPEQFTPEHGPGYLKKGPEYFGESANHGHPLRGNKWKIGATQCKTERFGPLIPSAGAREEQLCKDASFCTYEGDSVVKELYGISGVGATGLARRGNRLGPTYGSCDSHGLMGPKPIGPWGVTKMGRETLNKSSPSLLSTCM